MIIAKLTVYFSAEHVLFAAFVLTKVIFFYSVARLVCAGLEARWLVCCIVVGTALSGPLNSSMPFGGSGVLMPTSEQFPLALGILVLAGTCLVEGRWWTAVILASAALYFDPLAFAFSMPAFVVFALLDLRHARRTVFSAASLGVCLCVPWLILAKQAVFADYPPRYVEALFTLYPFHFTLSWTPWSSIARGIFVIAAASLMVWMAMKAGIPRLRRVEILGAAYLLPLSLGILFGQMYPLPGMIKLQLLRADSFAILYAFLLSQSYGARLVQSAEHTKALRAAALVLGTAAVLLPISLRLSVPAFIIALLLWIGPLRRLLEGVRGPVFLQPWTPMRLASASVALVLILVFSVRVARLSRLIHVAEPASSRELACRDVELWMKVHSPVEARSLVPTAGCGFRVFSERGTWGEWTDGNGLPSFPEFAKTYLGRMAALGVPPGEWRGLEWLEENYKRQTWDHLLDIARLNGLSYIIQFGAVPYPAPAIYRNAEFTVYEVAHSSHI